MEKNCKNCKMSFIAEMPSYGGYGNSGGSMALICGDEKNKQKYTTVNCDDVCDFWADPRENSIRFIQDE